MYTQYKHLKLITERFIYLPNIPTTKNNILLLKIKAKIISTNKYVKLSKYNIMQGKKPLDTDVAKLPTRSAVY